MNSELIAAVNATTERDAKRHRADSVGWELYEAASRGNIRKVAELILYIEGDEDDAD